VPESRAERPRRFDAIGQLLVVISLATLTATMIEGPHAGWQSVPILGGFVIAILAIVALLAHARRAAAPLIDLRFFSSWPFAAATGLAVLAFAAFNGALFLSSLYLQQARGLPPTMAGLCMLPIAVALVVCAPISGRLVSSGHTRTVLVIAGIAIAIGGVLITGADLETPIAQVVLALGIFGIGFGAINPPITNAAVSGMPRARAGVAAGLASTSRQVGASLGVALAGSIAAADGHDPGFSESTHPFWWAVCACGLAIVVLGLISTGVRAKRSVQTLDAAMSD